MLAARRRRPAAARRSPGSALVVAAAGCVAARRRRLRQRRAAGRTRELDLGTLARLRPQRARLRRARRDLPRARRRHRRRRLARAARAAARRARDRAARADPARGRGGDRRRPGVRLPARLGDDHALALPARQRRPRAARRARSPPTSAGGLSKIGGAALLAAFALLYGETGSFAFAVWAHAGSLGWQRAQRRLRAAPRRLRHEDRPAPAPGRRCPPLYAAAPAAHAPPRSRSPSTPASTGCGGSSSRRSGPAPLWWGELVARPRRAHARSSGSSTRSPRTTITRFLGFSSVEHAGIILLGFGVALLGQAAAPADARRRRAARRDAAR